MTLGDVRVPPSAPRRIPTMENLVSCRSARAEPYRPQALAIWARAYRGRHGLGSVIPSPQRLLFLRPGGGVTTAGVWRRL